MIGFNHMKKVTILFVSLLSGVFLLSAQTVGTFKPLDRAVDGTTIQMEDGPNSIVNGQHVLLNGLYGYPVSLTGTVATPGLTTLLENAFDFTNSAGYFQRPNYSAKPNEAISIRTDIPLTQDGVIGQFDININTQGAPTVDFISISETRGDFDTSKVQKVVNGSIVSGNPCYISSASPAIPFFISSTGDYPGVFPNGSPTPITYTKDYISKTQCRLIPGKTYYFNYRFQDAKSNLAQDSCAVTTEGWDRLNPPMEKRCGALLRITYSSPSPLRISTSGNTTTQNPVRTTQSTQGDMDPNSVSGTTNATQCISLTNNFAKGTRDAQVNNEVSLLQDFLSPKYLQVEPTGYFGAMTLNAVQAFQRESGFNATGYVGPLTRAKIKEISCGGGSTSYSNTNTNINSSRDNFKAPDYDVNGQIIDPTDKPSITIAGAAGVEVPFTNLLNNAPLTNLFETNINLEKSNYIFRSMGLEQEYLFCT